MMMTNDAKGECWRLLMRRKSKNHVSIRMVWLMTKTCINTKTWCQELPLNLQALQLSD